MASFGTSDVYQLFADAVIHYEDTLILTKGTHTMHFGFQGYRYRLDTFYSGNNGRAGTILFNGYYTTHTPGTGASSANGGIAEADLLLGLPDEIQGGVNGGTWGQRSNSLAAFFQDDWRASKNLTFNLGLRWELHTPWGEVKDRMANFNLVSGAEYIAGQSCPYNNCQALYNQYNGITNFQPRVGVAWTPGGGKTGGSSRLYAFELSRRHGHESALAHQSSVRGGARQPVFGVRQLSKPCLDRRSIRGLRPSSRMRAISIIP